MATDEMTTTDGFDTFTRIGDDGEQQSGTKRTIFGARIKFTNAATWTRADTDEILPPELELVVADIGRVVIYWGQDGMPIQDKTIILKPGQRFPDIEKMNDAEPRESWREDFNGNPIGPWEGQHVCYMVDMRDMSRFSWPTSTVGGSIAIEDLVERTKWKRRVLGPGVFPLVRLSHCFMNTRFKGRERPSFEVVNWVRLGGDGALPAASAPALAGPQEALNQFAGEDKPVANKPAEAKKQPDGVKTIEPPTVGEEMGDKVPW